MESQVIYVDGNRGTRDEDLEFVVIKHPQPLNVNDIGEAAPERFTVRTDLKKQKS